jgi:hypothetical protein
MKEDEIGRACNTHEMRNKYEVSGRKHEGKRPLERQRCTREDNIKMECKETKWESVDCFDLAQGRDWWWAVVNTVMNIQVP